MEVKWLEQCLADVPNDDTWLSAAEKLRCDCFHIPKRRADWRLGRWTAKQLVAGVLLLPRHLGALAAIEIRATVSGAPEVFMRSEPARVCISISHRAGVAVCATAPLGVMLGCDLELSEPRSDAFLGDYFTTEEQAAVAQAPLSERNRIAALIWSGKESTLKALGTGLRMDTRSISISLPEAGWNVTSPVPKGPSAERYCGSQTTIGSWSPLSACEENLRVFHGWWRQSGDLLMTLVSDPPASPPINPHAAQS